MVPDRVRPASKPHQINTAIFRFIESTYNRLLERQSHIEFKKKKVQSHVIKLLFHQIMKHISETTEEALSCFRIVAIDGWGE